MKLQGPVREGSGALKNYWGGVSGEMPSSYELWLLF